MTNPRRPFQLQELRPVADTVESVAARERPTTGPGMIISPAAKQAAIAAKKAMPIRPEGCTRGPWICGDPVTLMPPYASTWSTGGDSSASAGGALVATINSLPGSSPSPEGAALGFYLGQEPTNTDDNQLVIEPNVSGQVQWNFGNGVFNKQQASFILNILVWDNTSNTQVLDQQQTVETASAWGYDSTSGNFSFSSSAFSTPFVGVVQMTAGHQYSAWVWAEISYYNIWTEVPSGEGYVPTGNAFVAQMTLNFVTYYWRPN